MHYDEATDAISAESSELKRRCSPISPILTQSGAADTDRWALLHYDESDPLQCTAKAIVHQATDSRLAMTTTLHANSPGPAHGWPTIVHTV